MADDVDIEGTEDFGGTWTRLERVDKDQLQKHVVIAGHGRSGTNMVLDLFDRHRNTFCRNEPNELVGTAFTGLGDNMFSEPQTSDFDDRWRAAIAQTIRSSGARDRFLLEKDYFRSAARARLGQSLMSRQKFRALVLPRLNGTVIEEWPCPKQYYDSAAQARALPVLKILLSPAWIVKAHEVNSRQHVVHVQRRPQGFLQSWWSRYVTGIGGGATRVFADNRASLAKILRHFGREDEMPSQYSLHDLVVSELWRWRYTNEFLMKQLAGSPRYLKLAYEDLQRNKLHCVEKAYDLVGLEMTPALCQSIKTMENKLFKIRKPDALDPALVASAVQQVVEGSVYRDSLLGVTSGFAS